MTLSVTVTRIDGRRVITLVKSLSFGLFLTNVTTSLHDVRFSFTKQKQTKTQKNHPKNKKNLNKGKKTSNQIY